MAQCSARPTRQNRREQATVCGELLVPEGVNASEQPLKLSGLHSLLDSVPA
jgi:hypothetical protein